MFRDAAKRFIESEIVPNDARWREQHHVDRDIWNKAGEVGLLCTDIPAEYGGVGGDARHEAVVAEEMGRHGISSFGHVVHSILAHYVLNYGSESAEAQLAAADGVRRTRRRDRDDRARRGFRPAGGPGARRARRRPVRAERLEDVHLQRAARGARRRGREDGSDEGRQGHLDRHGRDEGPAGLPGRARPRQDRSERLGHRRDVLRRLPCAGRLPARAGGRARASCS